MKKLIAIAFAAFVLSSCSDTFHITEVIEVVEPLSFTRTFVVPQHHWTLASDDLGNIYFFREFEVPQLTRDVFDFGVMQAFMFYSVEGRNTLSPLPFTDFFGGWAEHFTVEFQQGFVTFIMKPHNQDLYLPYADRYEFLVRFLW